MIPFFDLTRQWQEIGEEITKVATEVLASGRYILGEKVREFEYAFAEFCNTKYAIGVASGTDALILAMQASGVAPGERVFLPDVTFFATALAVERIGAVPVLCDVSPETLQMEIPQCLIEDSSWYLPVHLFGIPVSIEAYPKGRVIEDSCQAVGALKSLYGKAGCFSFYPSKNLGACGDGGAIVTNDSEVFVVSGALRDYGRYGKYTHELSGTNSRLDALQAAILSVKLKYLPRWNAQRRVLAELYQELLGPLSLVLQVIDGPDNVWHLCVVQVDPSVRDALRESLTDAEIGVGVHYPMPLHEQPVVQRWRANGKCIVVKPRANSSMLSSSILSLPMFPELTEKEVLEVCNSIIKFFE